MPSGLHVSLHVSRRRLLKGAAIAIGLPPLEAMFDGKGIAYAATSSGRTGVPATPETRFVLWFNGNGVGEKYWIPTETGRDRALPPEMIPHKLFDRIFGARDEGWVKRKRSILDAVREDATSLKAELGKRDQARVEDHLASIRDVERAISTLPPEYAKVEEPETGGDMKDWPRIAKLQTDLLVHALATGQTRVASYMLTKCQGLSRFPWLGYTAARHHDYTHRDGKAPGFDTLDGQRIMRDINRWHVEEFAYLIAKLKSVPEGDGTLLDCCCLLYIHEPT